MRFGIFDHMEQRDQSLGELYEGRLQMLDVADRAGFWCYHKAEHHFTPLDAAPSSNVFLAAATQRTKRIRFGSLVYLLPFYDPIRLFEEICALDHLSGGRLEVGIGKGISPAEHTLWGADPESARPRFEEAFAVLRQAFANRDLSFSGEYHEFDRVELVMTPQQKPHPPFWYPGNVEYAGAHRLNTVVGGPVPAINAAASRYAELLDIVEDDWNPGVERPTIGVTRHIFVADTDAAAMERVESAYRKYHDNLATLFKRYGVPFPSGDPSFGGDAHLALELDALVAGSPETVAAHVRRVDEETPIDYFIGAFAWGDLTQEESMRSLTVFADEVMPSFA